MKGRRFPSGEQKQYWKNWSTRDDLTSLSRWEKLFGERFAGAICVCLQYSWRSAPLKREQLFEFQGALYGFVAIRLEYYATYARQISPRWDTVAMPVEQFRRFAARRNPFVTRAG